MTQELARELSARYKIDYQADVHFIGSIPHFNVVGERGIDRDLWSITFELVENCLGNRMPGGKDKATEVFVTFGDHKLTVGDNYKYSDPYEILSKIIQIRDSGEPYSTRPFNAELDYQPGGMGIWSILKILKKYNGSLNYRVENGGIVAEVIW